jgi:hypothetical protein
MPHHFIQLLANGGPIFFERASPRKIGWIQKGLLRHAGRPFEQFLELPQQQLEQLHQSISHLAANCQRVAIILSNG